MDDTTDSLLRIEAIFNEALAAPYEARKDLIAALSNGDPELIAEVCALLKACEVEERLTASLRPQPETGAENSAEPKRVGSYMLDRLLGRGGMGAVYLAHRADGQFEQMVAIKLIDLPLATNIFRERFRQERQILAGLQHPYIARLLDGGVTAGGDPFLVMEYVDGAPINCYCEKHGLSVEQRLALFLRVCEAVQFAHQNFVVHRDLKPDNILVAEDGTPRLLDFGTAKLLSPSIPKRGGDLTRDGYQSYTPQYASPEQVLGNPITTASDTYSLGVLLYLLLTGTQPYELKELTTAEMLRVVCEEAPRRPSQVEGQRLDADLEEILLKALRKEPRERYLTAEQFSSDIRAYLTGRPVAARHGTVRYRTAKFIRRHRLALTGTALLALTLIAGVAGVLWQARVANEERRKAEARSTDLRQMSNSLLSELDEAIKELPGSTGAQNLLVTRVLEHLDRMAKDALGDRQTQLDLSNAYTQLAAIQDDPYAQNLGDPTGALASLDKAIALIAPMASEGSQDRDAIRELALATELSSTILWQTGRTQEAVSAMQRAIKSFDVLVADSHASSALILEAAGAYNGLGDELGQAGPASLNDIPDAFSAYLKDLALVKRAINIDPDSISGKRNLILAFMKIGDIELETDPTQALKDYQIAMQRTDAGAKAEPGSPYFARRRSTLLQREASALGDLGEYSKAITLFTEDIQIQRGLIAADTQDWRAQADLEESMNAEAAVYEEASDPALAVSQGDRRRNLASAEKLLTQVAALMERATRHVPSNQAWKAVQADAQVRLATVQAVLHATEASATLAKRGITALENLASMDQASSVTLGQAASDLLKVQPASLRNPQFAVSCAERAVALSHRKSPSLLLTLAQAYRASGENDKSRASAREGLALLPLIQTESVKPKIRRLLEIQAKPNGQ
jgi:tetratricopeptide (TPR) repeat protein